MGVEAKGDKAAPPAPSGYTVHGARVAAPRAAPGLHIVATPIGNLGDVTLRALTTLAGVDGVLAEDTRVSLTLLAHYDISRPMTPYHEHNAREVRPKILTRLQAGAALALISDAGTPLISDPGYKLVAEAVALGIDVHVAPGPSAALAALCVAGLPTDRFFFEGFLPEKGAARRDRLNALAAVPATLIFYESARRLPETMVDLAQELGERRAAVARELTKLHEETRRGTLAELAEIYGRDGAPRGEIVIVVGPPGAAAEVAPEALDSALSEALKTHSVKDAAAVVAAQTGLPRRKIYARALALASMR